MIYTLKRQSQASGTCFETTFRKMPHVCMDWVNCDERLAASNAGTIRKRKLAVHFVKHSCISG
ncbi:MAG: hypothetical protein LBT46_09295 [Planctomycetaceae bacterium]|nr:hypothetical protein [Planctomycetaceae bacterium]